MRTAASAEIPVFQNIVQSSWAMRQHTLRVYGYRDNVESSWLSSLDAVHIHIFLTKNSLAKVYPVTIWIPRVGEGFNGLREPVGCPCGHKGIWATSIRNVWVKMFTNELIHKRRQRRQSFSSAILQGCRDVDLLRDGALRVLGHDYPLARLWALGLSTWDSWKSLRTGGRGFQGIVREIRRIWQSCRNQIREKSTS